MPSKKRSRSTYPLAVQTDAGWQCNTVAGCTALGVVQAAMPCGADCEQAQAEGDAQLERKRAELAEQDAAEQRVHQAIAEREDRRVEDLERLQLHVIAARRQELGAAIEALNASVARVAAEHDHPVFACEKHQKALLAAVARVT